MPDDGLRSGACSRRSSAAIRPRTPAIRHRRSTVLRRPRSTRASGGSSRTSSTSGCGLLTDGSVRWPDPVAAVAEALLPEGGVRPDRASPLSVDGWAFAQGVAGEAGIVKQCLPGPYTLGRRRGRDLAVPDRADLTLAFADALAGELVDLAAAGCVFIQVDEPAAIEIGSDPAERRVFVAAHDRLVAGLAPAARTRPHLSLAVVGGNADAAGPETIFARGL